MSLSRLPQVALRRLMPAISAVPKSLDDEQLKKILDPQQQTSASILAKSSLPAKSELSAISSTTQGIISALSSKPTASSSSTLGRLLMNLSGAQGVLSTQDLALLRAGTSGEGSLLATPEPGSPGSEHFLAIDNEPAVGALDAASVDALVSALRGTAAVISAGSPEYEAGAHRVASAELEHGRVARSVADEDMYFDQSDDDMPPISNDLSAAERRKEQNRRAQKKFRQKDKVRQKEIKWRASQYEDLVETNKRFKRDIDSISQERDMYRRILEQNGISLGDAKPVAKASRSAAPASAPLPVEASPVLLPMASAAGMEQIAQDTFGVAPMPNSVGMYQIAQDTFGTMAPGLPQSSVAMSELFNSLFGAVKADPMFGGVSTVGLFGPGGAAHRSLGSGAPGLANSSAYAQSVSSLLNSVASSSPPVSEPLYEGMIDHHVVDAPYVQSAVESQLVDPMAFIDELLASSSSTSPGFSPIPESPSFSSSALCTLESMSRKRSFDDAMF
ncbi:hypothetical protein IWW39_004172 [Coemansia spiralis]|uniref:BZIP domain-containing protein n=1 Tax=Coemansia spiralis TaxID=417178 RepID=A0A9W8L3W8_9FUNG|nr:hypothetical protein IWW39_004172 [Coemansia spiralis]